MTLTLSADFSYFSDECTLFALTFETKGIALFQTSMLRFEVQHKSQNPLMLLCLKLCVEVALRLPKLSTVSQIGEFLSFNLTQPTTFIFESFAHRITFDHLAPFSELLSDINVSQQLRLFFFFLSILSAKAISVEYLLLIPFDAIHVVNFSGGS